MNVKIYFLMILLLFSLTPFTPVSAHAGAPVANAANTDPIADPAAAARLSAIEARVSEIKSMDRSSLTKAERKALKKELKGLKKESRALGGGIYLSVGAIIIIILLLILIL